LSRFLLAELNSQSHDLCAESLRGGVGTWAQRVAEIGLSSGVFFGVRTCLAFRLRCWGAAGLRCCAECA